jgi:predicted lipoprotein with Yx(FWY)xxD motif
MSNHRAMAVLLLLLLLVVPVLVAGCGEDEDAPPTPTTTPEPKQQATASQDADMSETSEAGAAAARPAQPDAAQLERLARRPAGEDGLRVPAKRARLVAKESQFGMVLFDGMGQVLYAFENDGPGRSACTAADCVKAWPPMLTEGAPSAGRGIDASKLGTITREDGTRQVTYHGRPLYFYEHEAPGEIKCHNVNLHGGLWWVIRPDGRNA